MMMLWDCRGTVFALEKLLLLFVFRHFLGTFGVQFFHLFQFLIAELG